MYDPDNGVLTLRDIKFADRGSYRCEARSFLGSEKFTTKINVEGK
mgnify:CR=1 FL=1